MTEIRCDAIKIAYRQSKDGFVVSFVIHPQEMPALLANADIGSQWELTLNGLDEDGNAPFVGSASEPSRSPPATPREAVGEPPNRRPVTLAQRAGMLRKKQSYQNWLIHKGMAHPDWTDTKTGELIPLDKQARTAQHMILGVTSCSELEPNTYEGDKFLEHERDFTVWLKHPDLVA